MKPFLLILLSMIAGQSTALAQEDLDAKTRKDIAKVFQLAKAGYEQLDPNELIMAAKILLKNPHIQQFSHRQIMDDMDLSQEEQLLETYDFFNPIQLLEDAKRLAPVNDRTTRWRIKLLERKLPHYVEMGKKDGTIQVKNYLIYSNNSKTIDTKFEKNQRITLSVRIGDKLRLTVYDDNENSVGTSKAIGDARLVSFTAESEGVYKIRIENTADKPNDCYLMIEKKL